MVDVVTELNWLAVGLATLASFILGAVWFTPLFGKVYDEASGVKRQKDTFTTMYYVVPFVGSLATALATAILLYTLNVSAMADAIILALVVGLGYAASVSVVNAVNPRMAKPLLYGAVTGGYHVVSVLLVAVIIFVMK